MAEVGSYPNATALVGTERFVADQNLVTVNITPQQLAAFTNGGIFLSPSGDTSGATDTAAFQAAYTLAASSIYFSAISEANYFGKIRIYLAAGIFYINASSAMMAAGQISTNVAGLSFIGAGSQLTTISYTPSASGPLCVNNYWLNLRFSGLNFYGTDAASDFMDANMIGAIQDAYYEDCTWTGTWQNIESLTGVNNNSEWRFNDCFMYAAISNWIYVPAVGSGGSDQFLNFWFSKCKFWAGTHNAAWLNMSAGGSISIRDCDASGYGPTSDTYMFNLLGNNHNYGVMSFTCDKLRIEHTSDHALLMHSQWNQGSISFRDVDTTSQVNNRTPTVQYCNFENSGAGGGATIRFEQCGLIGRHAYSFGINAFSYDSRIKYEECSFLQQSSANAFLSITNVSGNSGGTPLIVFDQCRYIAAYNNASQPKVFFDSNFGWQNAMGGSAGIRTVNLVGANSDQTLNSNALWYQFPLNAVITRIRVHKPANTNTGPYDFKIQTNEVVPTVLAEFLGGNAALPIAADSALASGATGFASGLATTQLIALYWAMTSDTTRTIQVLDAQGRSNSAFFATILVDYIG